MLDNFHKTTSKHWQRTPGTQKGSPFSLKEGRTKYKRQIYLCVCVCIYMHIYTLLILCIKYITNESPMYSTWNAIQCSVVIEMQRKFQKEWIYVHAVLCLVAQSCLNLCDLMDCSPPGSFLHGIL